MNHLGVYSCDDNGVCENTTTFNFGGGYQLPTGTPTDKPIYNAGFPGGYPAPVMTSTTIAVIAIAVFALFAIGGRR